jgi:hypothetical protein
MPAKNQSDTEFGPAKNLAMNREWVMKVTIPAKWRIDIKFSTDAAFENAICIYDGKTLREVHEAGNYSRSLDTWHWDNDEGPAHHLLISGWHRKGAPDGGLPWNQSELRTGPRDGQSLDGGFEDWIDMDFNDIAFSVKIHKR